MGGSTLQALNRRLIRMTGMVLINLFYSVYDGSASFANSAESIADTTQSVTTIMIPAGPFAPLYGLNKEQTSFDVKAFKIDSLPVTNERYFSFLKKHIKWNKKTAMGLFADKNYLEYWTSNSYPKGTAHKPVVNVSWFAANAYCEAQNGRLPTTLEWEYVASRNNTPTQDILNWYSKPSLSPIQLPDVGKENANAFGVRNLHLLVWEWTSDFNSFFVASDNRNDGNQNNNLFCGSASTDAKSREDYAGFMRYALRSSLEASTATRTLGFRCAYDISK